MVRQASYINLPGFDNPVLTQLKLLDGNFSGTTYFSINEILKVYRLLRDCKIRGREDEILNIQPSVKNKKKILEEGEKKYNIKKKEDLEKADDSVRIYIKSLDSDVEDEKNLFRRIVGEFYEELFERRFSAYIGVLKYTNETKGSNAILYTNCLPSLDGQVDLTNANAKPINWPVTYGQITEDVRTLLGPDSFYFFADRERVTKEDGGLALVSFRFGTVTTISVDSVQPLSSIKNGKFGVLEYLRLQEIKQ